MNFGAIQAAVSRKVNGDSTFWSPDDISDAINETYEEACEYTGCYETETTIDLAAGQTYYNLELMGTAAGSGGISMDEFEHPGTGVIGPAQRFRWATFGFSPNTSSYAVALDPIRARNPGTQNWLQYTSYGTLDRYRYRWISDNAEPRFMFMRSAGILGLYPHVSAAGSTVVLTHTAIPLGLSAPTDVPVFAAEYHEPILVLGAASLLKGLERETKLAAAWYSKYADAREELADWCESRRGLSWTPTVGIGPEASGRY